MKKLLFLIIFTFYFINTQAQGLIIEFADTVNGRVILRQVSDSFPLPVIYDGIISDTTNITPFLIKNLKGLPLRLINETIIPDLKKENYTIIDENTDELFLV